MLLKTYEDFSFNPETNIAVKVFMIDFNIDSLEYIFVSSLNLTEEHKDLVFDKLSEYGESVGF